MKSRIRSKPTKKESLLKFYFIFFDNRNRAANQTLADLKPLSDIGKNGGFSFIVMATCEIKSFTKISLSIFGSIYREEIDSLLYYNKTYILLEYRRH